jgi:Xaa-Pro aminopeptidase
VGVASVDGVTSPSAKKCKLAIEDTMSLYEYSQLKDAFLRDDEPGAQFEVTHDVVLGLRAVKDAGEVAKLKAAQAITDAAFARVLTQIKPGLTEAALRNLLDATMFELGADGLAFPTIIACGTNAASPHAQPGERAIEAGQCIVMDFGARKSGYCSDMTRTVFVGEPTGDMRAAWDAIREANARVRAMLKPGVTGVEAHNLAEQVLAEAGFEGKMGHGLGHGVGLEIHEQPNLNRRNTLPLVAGNVVTVEPGIYIDGEFGMRLEDFGVITADGFETFTQSTHGMIVV